MFPLGARTINRARRLVLELLTCRLDSEADEGGVVGWEKFKNLNRRIPCKLMFD